MDEITVRIRANGKDYEDVVLSEMSWEEDAAIVDSCIKKTIDQSTMKEVVDYDTRELAFRRVTACIKNGVKLTAGDMKKLPRRDVEILQGAWLKINGVGAAEKSDPVVQDSRGQRTDGDGVPE